MMRKTLFVKNHTHAEYSFKAQHDTNNTVYKITQLWT